MVKQMRVADLESCVETWFECHDGDYGRYAHLVFEPTSSDSSRISSASTGEYVTMRRVQPKSTYSNNEPAYMEHCLVSGFIAQLDIIRRRMSKAGIKRPKLYWRFAPGYRFQLEESDEGTKLRTRIYIEGCSDYGDYAVTEGSSWLRLLPNDGHPAEHMRSLSGAEAAAQAAHHDIKLLGPPTGMKTMVDSDPPSVA